MAEVKIESIKIKIGKEETRKGVDMRNFKEYLELVCEGDIVSIRAKAQAKQRGLTHQSHNVWKDKGNVEYKWNEQGKKFEKVEKKSRFKQDYINSVNSWIDNAKGKSENFKEYIRFVAKEGHLTPSASSVFRDWIDKNKSSLKRKGTKQALNELFSKSSDSHSIFSLTQYIDKILKE